MKSTFKFGKLSNNELSVLTVIPVTPTFRLQTALNIHFITVFSTFGSMRHRQEAISLIWLSQALKLRLPASQTFCLQGAFEAVLKVEELKQLSKVATQQPSMKQSLF